MNDKLKNNNDLTKKVLLKINFLKTRPGVVIGDNEITYKKLRLFIEGYLRGLDEALNNNLTANIENWFQKKAKQKAPLSITLHILHREKDKSEEEIKAILLQTLEDFFTENPNWQEKYNPKGTIFSQIIADDTTDK